MQFLFPDFIANQQKLFAAYLQAQSNVYDAVIIASARDAALATAQANLSKARVNAIAMLSNAVDITAALAVAEQAVVQAQADSDAAHAAANTAAGQVPASALVFIDTFGALADGSHTPISAPSGGAETMQAA